MRRATILFAGVLLALLAGFALKGALLALPAVPAVVEAGAFDANRAHARLARVLADQQPHPVDSVASDGVRNRLISELQAAGLQPRVHDTMNCTGYADNRSVNCSRVRNIVASIGPAEGRHVLFVSHYDSVAAGPGASDDGVGVATMMEVASLLRSAPLARPITFLFNEGEETGLSGARAFLDGDPVAPLVDTLVNLESRGVEGPAIMFETSRPNGAAIDAFRDAVERPVANSLSTDFYRLIPNSTDVAVFEERPWTILNFAIIGDETRYHTADDRLERMDLRSLRHMGDQALALGRTFGTDAAPPQAGERIYADVAGRALLAVPLAAGLIALGLLVLLFGVTTWLRGGVGRPLVAVIAALVGATALTWAAIEVMQWLRPADFWRAYPLATFMAVYAGVLLACTAALLLIARQSDRDQVRFAAWFVFLAVAAAVCAVAPGAAIFFLVPPLVLALGAALQRWLPGAERVGAIAAALIAFVAFAEVLHLLELLLIDGPYWFLAPIAVFAALPLLIEAMPLGENARPRWSIAALTLLTLVGWTVAGLLPRASEDRQQLFAIEYLRDEDRATGLWAVSNKRAPLPDAYAALADWSQQDVPYTTRRRWAAAAPNTAVPAPTLTRVGERREGNARRIAFRLALNGSASVTIRMPADAAVQAAGTPGNLRPFGRGEASAPYLLRCYGRTCEGLTIELVAGSMAPVELTAIGHRTGLPGAAAPLVAARPVNSRPQYMPDSTYALRRFRF